MATVEGLTCRAVTEDEVSAYRRDGWAHLPSFVSAEAARELLAIARARMGEDGRGNAPTATPTEFFNPEFGAGLTNPRLSPLVHATGTNARRLMGRREGIGVRYFGDLFAVKLPASRETAHGGSGRTYFHQDFINWGVDRSGGMTVWIALEDYTAEAGTMAFVSGSHRAGTLGNYRAFTKRDVLEEYPELLDTCTISEPVTYRAGDATVHSALTVHGAGRNLTDHPRWAYTIIVNPSDARWTGAPAEAYATEGMTQHQLLDDERFPLLGPMLGQ